MSFNQTKEALGKWHKMLESGDMHILDELLADDIVFHSPVAYKPYSGKQIVTFILVNVIQVFENFTYHREFYTENKQCVVLEFSANIEEKLLKGVDMIRFNEQGKIIDFEVMIRPKSGLEALAIQMDKRLEAFLPK